MEHILGGNEREKRRGQKRRKESKQPYLLGAGAEFAEEFELV